MAKPKKTHEEFILEMNEINSNILILGRYIGARDKVKCKCLIDGNEWEAMPTNLLRGRGCPKCANKTKSEKQSIGYKQFINELNNVNNNIIIISKYINLTTKIKCKCAICGNEWYTLPKSLLQNHGCPKCANKTKSEKQSKSHDVFISELEAVNQNIKILNTYKNAKTKVKCECVICGHIWEAIPSNLLKGKSCPSCKFKKQSKRQTKTHEEFIQELQYINPNIEILTEYIDSHTKVDYKCNICNCHWSATPTNLLQGKGCPKCYISNGEKRIMKYLDNNNISYIYDKPYFNDLLGLGGKNLRPDFIIEDIKVWIEFDGEFHYNDFYKDGSYETLKHHDKLKDEYAKEHGWKLIRIPYWEYNNIESILNEILNKSNEVK